MRKFYLILKSAEIKYDESSLSEQEIKDRVYAALDRIHNFDCAYKTSEYLDEEEARAAFDSERVFIIDHPCNKIMEINWTELSYQDFDEDGEPDTCEIIDERFPAHEIVDIRFAAEMAVREFMVSTVHGYVFSVPGAGEEGGNIKLTRDQAIDRIVEIMEDDDYDDQGAARSAAKSIVENDLRTAETIEFYAAMAKEEK